MELLNNVVFAAQSEDVCDPAIERCAEGDTLLRPGGGPLFWLMTNYFLNQWILVLSAVIATWLDLNVLNIEKYRGYELIFHFLMWYVMVFWDVLIWALPTFTLFLYLLFGSNFFLFRWTDEFGVWFITTATSRWSFNTQVGQAVILLTLGILFEEPIQIWTFILYSVLAAGLQYSSWGLGVDAARRIDPSWNEHRGRLYPPFFYTFGWVQDEPYEKEKDTEFGDVAGIINL